MEGLTSSQKDVCKGFAHRVIDLALAELDGFIGCILINGCKAQYWKDHPVSNPHRYRHHTARPAVCCKEFEAAPASGRWSRGSIPHPTRRRAAGWTRLTRGIHPS